MRIGFDASPLVRPHPPGIVRLVRGAMEALERTPGLTALRLAPAASEDLRLWRHLRLPLLVRERGLAGIHSFVSAFPLAGPGLRFQTIHELPWLHGTSENAGLGHRFWAAVASRRADRILCGSHFVAHELGRGALASRVRVCPWGVDAARFALPPAPEVRARLSALLGVDALAPDAPPMLLAVGAVRPKKNLASLLRGLAERRRRMGSAVLLAVTGEVGPAALRDQSLARELGLSRDVHWVGNLDEADLIGLLHSARAAVVLSRSEGFGLPVLEAFAAGRPVIVPRHSAQAEVAGGLGIEVDPLDAGSVADGIELALAGDDRAGERQAFAAQLSWTRCAARIAEIWSECA